MRPSISDSPRVLIVKLSSLGDVVHALPVATALRRRHPGAYLGWCVGRAAAPLVVGHRDLDAVFVLDRQHSAESAGVVRGSHRRLGRAMRACRFDVSLDLQGLLKSAWLAYLSGAPCRVGYRSHQEGAFLLNRVQAVGPAQGRHVVENYLEFARFVGAAAEPVEFAIPRRQESEARAANLLQEAGVGERPAAVLPATLWESKRWPAARFGELCVLLAERGLHPVVLGGAGDAELCQAVVTAAGGRAVSLAGRTAVGDLAPLLARCAVVVGSDSGPVHLAAALGVPVVAIFGPTDPGLTRPYGPRVAVVRAGAECSPCRHRICPSLICQERVSVADVARAAWGLLGEAWRDG